MNRYETPRLDGLRVSFTAADGRMLVGHVYGALSAKAVVVMFGAAATPQRFYRRWAVDLSQRGYAVLTFDYRGIGQSRQGSVRADPATMTEWAYLDCTAALDLAQRRFADRPVFAMCHSFGGQALGIMGHIDRLNGVQTVGAQLGYVGHWDRRGQRRLWLIWRLLVPTLLCTFGYWPGWSGIGHDMPAGVAAEWRRWCLSPHYLLSHHPDARAQFVHIQAPVHVYQIADDPLYGPKNAVRAFHELFVNAALEVVAPADIGVAKIGHFGFFRPPCASLWDAAAGRFDSWLDTSKPASTHVAVGPGTH